MVPFAKPHLRLLLFIGLGTFQSAFQLTLGFDQFMYTLPSLLPLWSRPLMIPVVNEHITITQHKHQQERDDV